MRLWRNHLVLPEGNKGVMGSNVPSTKSNNPETFCQNGGDQKSPKNTSYLSCLPMDEEVERTEKTVMATGQTSKETINRRLISCVTKIPQWTSPQNAY